MIAGYVIGTRAAARAAGMSVVANAIYDKGGVADLDALNERVDRLLLVTEALWTLLKQNGHTDEELAALIAELDQADGLSDRRRAASPTTCSKCQSKVAANLTKCQICGAPTGVKHGPLDGI
jgi:hypothetical protein